MEMAIYASLMSLALGLFTSMSFLSLTHIFIFIPMLWLLPKTHFKQFNKSSLFLLILIFVMILSVLFNQDIATNGYSPILKTKYYLLALLSIAPFSFYFRRIDDGKARKIRWLLIALFVTTVIAGLSGIIGVVTGFNLLKWRAVITGRNSGLAGMVLNYAHNLAFLQVLATGLLVYKDEAKRFINLKFLTAVWLFNLVALIMTYTRGAILAFLVAVPFYFFRKNRKLFLIIAGFLVLAASVTYKMLGELILRPLSDVERLSQWKTALYAFKERPVLGFGFLNFESHSVPLKYKYGIEATHFGGHAHNNYLEIMASCGIMGLIFFLAWQISWFNEMNKRDDLIAKLSIPFMVAFLVSGLTQATFNLGANLFFIMSFYAITQLKTELIEVNNTKDSL